MCLIDEAATNTAFIWKRYYVEVILKELELDSTQGNRYQPINDTFHNVLELLNTILESRFNLKNTVLEFD